MNDQEYAIASSRTRSEAFYGPRTQLEIDLLHAAIGIVTEAGELQDALKREMFYGKPHDKVNVVEELGDLLWYISLAADSIGVTLEEIKQANINKLYKRYPNKFSETDAISRNLVEERKQLESSVQGAQEAKG